jgi:hypothetical protein
MENTSTSEPTVTAIMMMIAPPHHHRTTHPHQHQQRTLNTALWRLYAGCPCHAFYNTRITLEHCTAATNANNTAHHTPWFTSNHDCCPEAIPAMLSCGQQAVHSKTVISLSHMPPRLHSCTVLLLTQIHRVPELNVGVTCTLVWLERSLYSWSCIV